MDPFLILFQLIVIGLYVFRFPIISRFPGSLKEFYLLIAADMKLRAGTWKKTVLIPVLVIIASYLVWVAVLAMVFFYVPVPLATDPLPVFFVNSVILAPLSEEILQCFFLSAAFVIFVRLYKNAWALAGMSCAALVIVSYIFANAHTNPTPVNWLLRFFQFIIYGALYYLNGRNLLPAIVAHAAWNLVLLNPVVF